METSAMGNSEEEEKCLSVFDELQSIIDAAEDTKIDLEHRKRNMLEKLEESKEKETKEREESERDIQRETKKRSWTKEKKFKLDLEREIIDSEELKVEMGVNLESTYEEANTDDTVVRNYGNTVKLPKLELRKFDGNI